MALTLGKSFNRQIKFRIPYQNYFYDIGIFYTTKINFNLFDIKPIFKYDVRAAPNNVKINMFKNIESSTFCMECLELGEENNRPSYYKDIKKDWETSINCEFVEYVQMDINNYLNIYMFHMKDFKDDFRFILAERKNIMKIGKDQIVSSLSGIQISTSEPIEMIQYSINQNIVATPADLIVNLPKKEVIKLSDLEGNINAT